MNGFHRTSVAVVLIATACTWNIHAKSLSKTLDYAGVKAVVNYDETKVQPYTLEDPLVFTDGTKVENAVDWSRRRREILDIFSKEMYGKEPPLPETLDIKVVDEKISCAGFAIRKRFRMGFKKDGSGPKIDWILYRPRHAKGPVPVIVFLNYRGNHELTNDPDVKPTSGWCKSSARTDGHRASERTRGAMTDPASNSYLPMNSILARGYAVMSACYCEVSPDPINPAWGEKEFPQDTFSYTGVFDLWPKRNPKGESEISSMGAWAWALSRAVDYVHTDSSLDSNRIVATGCSRLAKAALLASARDERIAVCVPVQTGGGGCPLSKRNYGETVQVLMLSFSHWFCKAYGKYAKEPWNTLPFDQHLLLASIAPRALLVLGFDNRWYDPKGEYLAVKAASPVWEFLGAGQFPDKPFPEAFDLSCVGGGIGYAMRSEEHGISAWDWKAMLDFADASFASKLMLK